MSDWQPMETLPDHGYVLLFFPCSGLIDIALVLRSFPVPLTANENNKKPSHWMKMPDPPEGARISGGDGREEGAAELERMYEVLKRDLGYV
jgi:hypothetical protein